LLREQNRLIAQQIERQPVYQDSQEIKVIPPAVQLQQAKPESKQDLILAMLERQPALLEMTIRDIESAVNTAGIEASYRTVYKAVQRAKGRH